MELIWNAVNFSRQAKERLGFVDADLSFARMESALHVATSEIADIISEEKYEEIRTAESETEFSRLVQHAILLRALIIYVPTSDLAFTNRGRKLRTDDHDGTPWQWMLDANSAALDDLYYLHLNGLLKHMFSHGIPVNVEKFNHKELLVASLNDFEKHFNIRGSYWLYLNLLPALQECEELELLPRIQSVTEPDFLGMKNIAQKICVYYAMDWGLRRLNVQLFPKNVFQETVHTGGKTLQPVDKLQHLETAMVFEKDWKRYLIALERMVRQAQQYTDPYPGHIVIDSGIRGCDNFIDT